MESAPQRLDRMQYAAMANKAMLNSAANKTWSRIRSGSGPRGTTCSKPLGGSESEDGLFGTFSTRETSLLGAADTILSPVLPKPSSGIAEPQKQRSTIKHATIAR